MATASHTWEYPSVVPAIGSSQENWYAVQTRARHEKVVQQRFREKGLDTFLPLMTEVRRWSDRKKVLEVPLFSCYVFVRIANTNEDRQRVLFTESVFDLVGVSRYGTPIPDAQIAAVRTVVEERVNWRSYPFLKIGQRVRVRSGALAGVEGILVDRNRRDTLVISVDLIQRSMAIQIDGYSVEPV